jgi:hypothetical protein
VKATVSDKVIFEELDDQVVLLDLQGGSYYKLNGTGTQIWALIMEHGDIERIEETIAARFDVDPERARRDIARLVEDLESRGLIVVDRT